MFIWFLYPKYLLLLFAIPILILVHFFSLSVWRAKAVKFANFEAISRIKGIGVYSRNLTILMLSILFVVLISFSTAGTTVEVQLKTSEFSFVLAIDSSQSMGANDFFPSRIDAAKDIAIQFVRSTPIGTRIGVVSFSGNSFIEQEVSDEKSAVIDSIKSINLQEVGGTDVQEAVVTSTNLLNDESNRAIILLSDGQINTGGLEESIEYAKKKNVIIHTISIGTSEGGLASYGVSKVDEDTLKALSYNTGGNFSTSTDRSSLSDAFEGIISLKVSKVGINFSKYLAVSALLLFIIIFVLANTRYKAIP